MRAVLVLIALFLAGCQAERRQLGQALSGKVPVVDGSLVGGWTIADLNGGGPVAGARLDFGADTLTGTAGCNRISGPWRSDGGRVQIGPLASTRMACAPAVMAVEARVLALLAAADQLRFDERGNAVISTGDGRRLRLIPALAEAPKG